MKTTSLFLLFALSFFTFSCEPDRIPDPELTGRWELTDILSDPGDGSGTFQPVDSDLRVTFSSNGRFTANGNICSLSGSTEGSSSGTYDAENQTLQSEDCNSWRDPLYEVDGDQLVIQLACIEACALRFRKE